MRAIEFLTEYRDRMYQYIKSIVPGFPDYVVKDWLYANFARGATQGPNWSFDTIGKDIPNILKDMGLSVDTKWQLVPNMKFTMDMWEPKTLKRLQARAGGSSKSTEPDVHIPARDAERHATQAQLAQQQGGVRKEPVILIKTTNGYELLEGWHRTIQHFHKFPDGYTGPAYVAVARPRPGVAEGSLKEFATGDSGSDSGRWYTDDELADIIGDDWFEDFDVSNDGFNIDAYGEKAKQNLVDYANTWFDDRGYNVNVLGVEHNDVDHDLKWYIVGSFHNPGFANKGVAEGFSNDMSTKDMIAYLRQHHDTNLHQDYLNHLNTFSKFVLKDIPTNTLKTDLPGLDREKVERYKKMDQSKAPPIVLGGKYILDGYHRANAVKEMGIPTIKAYVGISAK